MIILVSGDREWKDEEMIDTVVAGLVARCEACNEPVRLIHGAARGADSMVQKWDGVQGVVVDPFPAEWSKYRVPSGRKNPAGAIRNRTMLDEKPDLVVAFHDDLSKSHGTRDCVTEAKIRGIRVWVFGHG